MITAQVQRWRNGRGSYRPAGEPIRTSDFDVQPIAKDNPAKAFVCAHHYSASYPAARFRFGLYRSGELVGVAVFSEPANRLSLACLPCPVTDATELGRFVLLDDVPANGETWFLARCFGLLAAEGVAGVISFSDPMPRSDARGVTVFPGHVGTIYQASNAVYLGRARGDALRLLPDGTVLHNRAIAKLRKRDKGWRYVAARIEAAGAGAVGEDVEAWLATWLPRVVRRVKHPGNLKYAFALDRRMRKRMPASLPYEKMALIRQAAA